MSKVTKRTKTTKGRNVFAELMQGVDEMRQHREGQLALRTRRVETKPLRAFSRRSSEDPRGPRNVARGLRAHDPCEFAHARGLSKGRGSRLSHC